MINGKQIEYNGFELFSTDVSLNTGETVQMYYYENDSGIPTFLTAKESLEVDARLASNVSQSEEQQTRHSNIFESFTNATEEARNSENEVKVKEEQTTGEVIENVESTTSEIGDKYNEINPGNTETSTEINEQTVINVEDIPRTSSTSGFLAFAGAAIGLVVAVVGTAAAITAISKSAASNGLINSTKKRRIETKLNANSTNYKLIKKAYNLQVELDKATDEKEIKRIQAELDKVTTKLSKKTLTNTKINSLIKSYANKTQNRRGQAAHVARTVFENDIIVKENVESHAKIIEKHSIIEGIPNNPDSPYHNKRQKRINKLEREIEGLIPKTTYLNTQIGNEKNTPLYFATNIKIKDNLSLPLHVNRAITNGIDNEKFDTINKQVPYAEAEVRMCTISLLDENKNEIHKLKCVFDNKIGYNVSKAMLVQEAFELKKNNPSIVALNIKESETIAKDQKTTTTSTSSYDFTKNDSAAAFLDKIDKSEEILNTFDEKFLRKPKPSLLGNFEQNP